MTQEKKEKLKEENTQEVNKETVSKAEKVEDKDKKEDTLACSPEMRSYFDSLQSRSMELYNLAKRTRTKGFDPEDFVEITLAANLAERVIGLISVVAPQIKNAGVEARILELEDEYGALDWRVAFIIALEISQEKYCKFKDKKEAIEVGIRAGFAYVTVGVVSSPIEGFTDLIIKKRNDGKGEYFELRYAGPIRNAGGTAAAVSVLIADYVRKHLGYAEYDPTDKEIKRCAGELEDYHNYITNLQYFPSKQESEFLMQRIPVCIAGDASEKYEVSNINLKDLPRVDTNKLRSGYCLIHSSCIPLKAPKLWAKLDKWGSEMGMEQWNFLGEFVKLQKKIKSRSKKETKKDEEKKDEAPKVVPDYTFIKDLVAGRPVLGYPLRPGGFRLRYGRSRASGYSGQAVNPATMEVLQDYVAIGTQLKVERPGKAAAFTPCDTIDGPIVKLKNGSVIYLPNTKIAKKYKKEIEEVIYLGDVLINYGDFFDRAHPLVPMGYCPEYWALELEEKVYDKNKNYLEETSKKTNVSKEKILSFIKNSFKNKPNFIESVKLSKGLDIPLHADFTLYWSQISTNEIKAIVDWIKQAKENTNEKIILPLKGFEKEKRSLEILGLEHVVVSNEYVIIHSKDRAMFLYPLKLHKEENQEAVETIVNNFEEEDSALKLINALSDIKIKDKAGTFIGARMGRPEKAKMRKLTGSPHVLFPVGEEGGRLRSFQSVLDKEGGFVQGQFPKRKCEECNIETPNRKCELCGKKTNYIISEDKKREAGEDFNEREACVDYYKVNVRRIFNQCLKKMRTSIYPDLIKGVRGTVNKTHIPENLMKGILRAKHNIHVNKDGTIRYDASEITLTHFKPKEVHVPWQKLKEIGYTHDVYNKELENDEQILELKCQDVVLPCCPDSPDEPADQIMLRTTKFIDDLLFYLYDEKPYFNYTNRLDLVGELIIGLAPHTSAGTLGRIIGFSQTQGFLAHPYFHAAMRRDCFTYDSYIPIKKGKSWIMIKIGELVEELNPTKIVDNYGTKEIKTKNYYTIGYDKGKLKEVKINNFTKHTPQKIVELKTKLGRLIKTTLNHKHIISINNKENVLRANQLKIGDKVKLPYNIQIKEQNIKNLNLLELFKNHDYVMVKGLKNKVNLRLELKKLNLSKSEVDNFSLRDSTPIIYANKIIKNNKLSIDKLFLSVKRDKVKIPAIIELNKDFLEIIGLYIAEGYSRKNISSKGFYQVYISASKKEIRTLIKNYFNKYLGLKPSENKDDRVTYSSRLLYELFIQKLNLGSSAYEKRFPNIFLNLPINKIKNILSGYFEGDGSVSKTDLRLTFDTVSKGLIRDIEFLLSRMNIFLKIKEYSSKPGSVVREFYENKNLEVPEFLMIKGIIQSKFVHKFSDNFNFLSKEKKEKHEFILKNKKFRNLFCEYDDNYFYDEIVEINDLPGETTYCLNVPNNKVVVNGILTKQCDGDEACFVLLGDAFMNFSRSFLSQNRGATMDAPIVLTSILKPTEVDDMAFKVDIVNKYPLQLYRGAENFQKPWEISVKQIQDVLNTKAQFEGMMFTHDTSNINDGVKCSAYKLLPSMVEKIEGQMKIACQVRACDPSGVAQLVIDKHFIRDLKGNLRKFSQQQFRCVACNEKFRRPPLIGKCTACGGKVIFTISQGSVMKYLEPSLNLAYKYGVSIYLQQDLELLKRRIEAVFGREPEKQEGLDKFFS